MKHVSALTVIAIVVLLLSGVVGPRVFAQGPVTPPSPAPAPAPMGQLQIEVTGVERAPALPAATLPGTPAPAPADSPVDLFVYVKVRYSGADPLHFYAGDIGLRDASGVVQSPQACDLSGKLSSKLLMSPPPPAGPATVRACLHYTVSTSGLASLALEYLYTEQASQSAPGVLYRVPAGVPAAKIPGAPTPRRAYATATRPALRRYLLDEALAGGYIALNLDPLYAGGADATVPGTIRGYIAGQAARLAADHRAFLAVDASSPGVTSDPQTKKERADVDGVLTAIDASLAALPALRANAQWAQWRATFALENDVLAGLYEAWPATVPPQ